MIIFEQVLEWGWILAGALLLVTVIFLAMTALRFKTAVMGHAKRLSERPINSAKSLAATGKAVVQQEQVRVKHMMGTVKGTAGVVKEAGTEVKEAAQTIHPDELKSGLADAQRTLKQVTEVAALVGQFREALAKQSAPHIET